MRITNEQRFNKIKVFTIGIAVLVLALLYFLLDARNAGIFPHCPFHSLTGLFCPGCGSQRAVSALLHGEVLQALGFNILFVLSLPIVLYSCAVAFLNSFRHQQIQQKIFYSPSFVKVLLIVVVVFGIARNIPIQPFALLAPH